MLWTAIQLTRLTLDCIPQAPERAFAVVEKRRIVIANDAAQAAGVRTGHGLAAVVFEDGESETNRISDGQVSGADAAALAHGLAEALATAGTLLVFAHRDAGGLGVTGYELMQNVIRPLSSAEARGMAASFAEQLGGAPVEAADAPMLEYDPG